MNPAEALATQLAVYMEEKQEDQEEYRERRLEVDKPSRYGFLLSPTMKFNPQLTSHLKSGLLDPELAALISEQPRLLPEIRIVANHLASLLAEGNEE